MDSNSTSDNASTPDPTAKVIADIEQLLSEDAGVDFEEAIGKIESGGEEVAVLLELIDELKRHHEEINEKVVLLSTSMDDLRLNIKYLLFDLDATRRENKQLRKMLEGDTDD